MDIRWIQRLENYRKALSNLSEAVGLAETRPLSNLEEQGLIQAFEFTYELAWNTIKDFYSYQGDESIQGSRDAFRMAFKRGLIINGDIWMQMIKARQLSSHTYNEETADIIYQDVCEHYHKEFLTLLDRLDSQKAQME
ncbi:MAG: nucleotidyltransferase substrate binding protein [Francisellaceae bacterium]